MFVRAAERSSEWNRPQWRSGSFDVKIASAFLAFTGILGALAAPTVGQAPSSAGSVKNVSRTTKAVNYRRAGGTTMINFQGTELMQVASGEAKVQNKGNRIEIEAKFMGLDDATKFGLEYLTYVLWAVSPQGRAVNLGEVVLKSGAGQVKAINDMHIFGIDRKTPLELFEARNAVRIARIALADKYAASTFSKAEQQLRNAEEVYGRKSDKKSVEAAARETVGTAEEARVMAVKQKAEEDAQAKVAGEKRAAEEREARARADAASEIKRRQEADQARAQAEAAKADAERMKQEAEKAAAEAARQKQEADQATAAAVVQQQAAQAAADQAARDRAAAEAETQKARQAAAQAEAEKAQLRAQLLSQLNSILQTRDSARGLIVNMSDV